MGRSGAQGDFVRMTAAVKRLELALGSQRSNQTSELFKASEVCCMITTGDRAVSIEDPSAREIEAAKRSGDVEVRSCIRRVEIGA